jgi:hypothetical protein
MREKRTALACDTQEFALAGPVVRQVSGEREEARRIEIDGMLTVEDCSLIEKPSRRSLMRAGFALPAT